MFFHAFTVSPPVKRPPSLPQDGPLCARSVGGIASFKQHAQSVLHRKTPPFFRAFLISPRHCAGFYHQHIGPPGQRFGRGRVHADMGRLHAAGKARHGSYLRKTQGRQLCPSRITARSAGHIDPRHNAAQGRPMGKRRQQHMGKLFVAVFRPNGLHQMRQSQTRITHRRQRGEALLNLEAGGFAFAQAQ